MRCDIVGLLRLKLAGDGARQNNAVANAFNCDVRVWD